MARQTCKDLGVKANDVIVIKGKAVFSRIDKLVEGDALIKENENRTKRGMFAAEKPFRSITLEDPEIVQGEGSPLAAYYGQSVYTNKKSHKKNITLETKSPFPPAFGHMQEDGSVMEIADPMKNPNVGQVVYVMLKAFDMPKYNTVGTGFDSIVYGPGPISFYETNALAGFGQAMGIAVTENTNTDIPEGVQPEPATEQADTPVNTGQSNAFVGFGVQDSDIQPPQGNAGQPQNNPFA